MKIPTKDELALIDGRISKEEGEYLMSLASQVPLGGLITEIGSYRGKSTCYLATGLLLSNNTSAKVQAIDLWTLGGTHSIRYGTAETWLLFNQNIKLMELSNIVTPYISDSVKAASRHRRNIDLLFIDGCHNYKFVKADWIAWRKFVKPGSIIAFHDYDRKFPGVVRVVEEIVVPMLKLVDINKTGRLWSARIV